MLHRLLEQLQGGVFAVLLDHEQLHTRFLAGAHHAQAVFPLGGHGFFAEHVPPAGGHLDGLAGMQAAGSGQDHAIGRGVLQQALQAGMASGTCGSHGFAQGSRIDVANIHQLGVFGVLGNGVEVVLGNAPAAHQGEADFAVDDGAVRHGRGHQSLNTVKPAAAAA